MEFLEKRPNPYFYPWLTFVVFTFANGWLSYGSISYLAKGWIAVLGLMIPWVISVFYYRFQEESNLMKMETFKDFSNLWIYVLFFGAALFLRFFHLTDFYLWPTGDEGLHGFLAISLIRKWNWQFFYTVGEHPPLLIWSLVPLFKYFNSPFFDLWFLPAFFSFIAVPAGYWVSRQYFSRSFSWLCGFLLAFSFWPLYFGHFCEQGLFIPFWEFLGFLLLFYFMKSQVEKQKLFWAILMGLWIGLGSLTFTSWLVVILLFALTMMAIWLYTDRRTYRYLIGFLGGLFIGAFPFILAAIQSGYGQHFIDVSTLSHYFTPAHELITNLSFITCLFWGTMEKGSSYAPVWGGVLNPILSSCFFIGTIEMVCRRNEKIMLWIGGAFLILFLPGLLCADYVEFIRVYQAMPILLLITAIGLQRLVVVLPRHKKWILIPLLVGSFLLDMNQLLKPAVNGPTWHLDFKKKMADENFIAYQIFHQEYTREGPGLIFTDFMPLTHGHTLHVTTYHFNAALNPKLKFDQAKWVGLMVNVHYQKFLKKRFPDSVWESVTPIPPGEGGMVVGIIPITSQNISTFTRWDQVHQYFYYLNLQAENMYNSPELYRSALVHFSDGYPLMRGDPFLESCFGEWVTQFHWGRDYRQNIVLLKHAIQTGYPCAHLYYKLGEFLFLDHDLSEAKTAFMTAMRCHPNQTQAAEWIQTINQIVGPNKGK